jgi:hypothetical protein
VKVTDFKFLVVSACLIVLSANARQSTGRISGRVVDDSTNAPVFNANVFIANSMRGASSDSSGHFEIRNVPFGFHEVVASCVGYVLSTTKVELFSDESPALDIRLKPKLIGLGVVEVTAPPIDEWRENLKTFTKLLLGSTKEASDCRIVNPEVIDFSIDPLGRFRARSEKEVIIDNSALGYRLYLNLGMFQLDGRWLSSLWKVKFEELQSVDPDQESDWQKRRQNVYNGSLQHFLVSLLNDDLGKEGFVMLSSETADGWKKRSFLPELKRRHVLTQVSPNVWRLKFKDFLVVVYDRITVSTGFGRPAYSSRTSGNIEVMNTRPQVSVLSLTKDSLMIDLHGKILDALTLKVSEDWGKEGVARSLPAEYVESIKK